MSKPFRVRLERLRVKPNIPAGMDPCVLLGMVPPLRGSHFDHDPILVRWDPATYIYTILDGRHRFVAALIAGRSDILAMEENADAT